MYKHVVVLGFVMLIITTLGVPRTLAQIPEMKPGRSTHSITATIDGVLRKLTYVADAGENVITITGLAGTAAVMGFTLEELQRANPNYQFSIKPSLDPRTLFLTVVIPTPNRERVQTSWLFPLKMKENSLPWERIQMDSNKLSDGELRIVTDHGLLAPGVGTFSVAGEKTELLLGNLLPGDEVVVFLFRLADKYQ